MTCALKQSFKNVGNLSFISVSNSSPFVSMEVEIKKLGWTWKLRKTLDTVVGHGIKQTFKVEHPRFSSHSDVFKDTSILQKLHIIHLVHAVLPDVVLALCLAYCSLWLVSSAPHEVCHIWGLAICSCSSKQFLHLPWSKIHLLCDIIMSISFSLTCLKAFFTCTGSVFFQGKTIFSFLQKVSENLETTVSGL